MAKNEYLGAKHLAGKTIGDLQRVNNFMVQIDGLPTNLMFMVQGMPLPSSENEVLSVKFGNSVIKLPGPASFSEGEITFRDSIDLDTEQSLYDWRLMVYDPVTERIGKSTNFKKNAMITEYSPDGSVGRQWKMEGVWPSAFKPGEMNNDGSEIKTMSLTLQYDRAYRVRGKK